MTDDLQKRIERQLLSSFIEPQVIAAILRDCQSEIATLQRQLEAAETKIATAREMLEDLTGGFTSEADMQAARLVIDELIGKVNTL